MEFQRKGDYAASGQLIEKGLEKVPNHEGLLRLREEVRAQLAAEQQRQAEQAKREQEIKALLKQAEAHWKAKRLTEPAANNAQETYRQVLELDAGNAQAQAGLERIAQEYWQQAQKRRSAGALQDSLGLIDKGLAVVPNHEELWGCARTLSVGSLKRKPSRLTRRPTAVKPNSIWHKPGAAFRKGSLETSLAHIEQGLLAAPGHPGFAGVARTGEGANGRTSPPAGGTGQAPAGRGARRQRRKRSARRLNKPASRPELAKRQQEEDARRQAEEAERQKAEQARQQVELAKRQQEADQYLARAVESQRKGEQAASLQQIEQGLSLMPNHAELLRLREAVRARLAAEQKRQQDQAKREQEIKKLLEQAEGHVKAKRLTTPAGKNARETYRRVLELDAGNTQAQAGLERIAQEYLQQAQQRRLAGALQDCLELIDKGLAVVPDQAELLRLREEVRAEWSAEQQRLEQQRQSEQQKAQQRKEQQRPEQQRQSEQQKAQQRKEQQRWNNSRNWNSNGRSNSVKSSGAWNDSNRKSNLWSSSGRKKSNGSSKRSSNSSSDRRKSSARKRDSDRSNNGSWNSSGWNNSARSSNGWNSSAENRYRNQNHASEPTKPRVFGTF